MRKKSVTNSPLITNRNRDTDTNKISNIEIRGTDKGPKFEINRHKTDIGKRSSDKYIVHIIKNGFKLEFLDDATNNE